MAQFTSDGIARSNIAMFAMNYPTIPTSIGLSARVGVLVDVGNAVVAGGANNLQVMSRAAAYDNSSVTQRINDISAALNTLGASPPLPIYSSLDYNAFTSVMNNIVAKMASMP
jgi:hypothetical protein